MSVALQVCPDCRAPLVEGDVFCEQCGADLAEAARQAAVPGAAAPGAAAPGAVAPGAVAPGAAVPAQEAAGGPSGPNGRPAGAGPLVQVDEPDLSAMPVQCVECGGQVDPDGYCGQCGTPAPNPRDHWTERPASWVAAVCDRGIRHPHNEDAVAVAAAAVPGSFAGLVVCDGVSSSNGSAVASLAAVRAAREVLLAAAVPRPQRGGAGVESSTLAAAAVPAGPGSVAGPVSAAVPDGAGVADGAPPVDGAGDALPPTSGLDLPVSPSGSVQARAGSLATAIVEAGLRANGAVVASAGDPPRPNPPSCTFAAAVVEGALLVAGWVGDSRVYWLPDAGHAVQVSADDSWAGEAIAAGIPREDAERAPQAHAITRWFGVDAPDPRAHTAALRLDRSGWVVVCSDGLWNYCSRASDLQTLVIMVAQRTGPDPAALASELVTWAKQQGGHDNITVALARVR